MAGAQMQFDMPPPPAPEIDYETDARADLGEALALAKAAVDAPPWDYRKHRYWRIVFPQMATWLPAAEREPLVAEFLVEWERIDTTMFWPEHIAAIARWRGGRVRWGQR